MPDKKNIAKLDSLTTNDQLEVRSEEVQDILSYIPHWIIRWGVTIIFLTIILLLFVSWIIKYPDIITSRVIITTQNPPIKVIARSTGKLVEIFVKENDFVKSEAYLGVIENPANLQDIFELRNLLNELGQRINEPDKMLLLEVNENAALGDLQTDYSNLLKDLNEYRVFKQENYHANKIKTIEAQISFYRDLNQKAARQKQIFTQDLELTQKKYERDKSLFERKLISENELDNSEGAYLQKKVALESAESTLINQNLQLTEYEKSVMDLKFQLREMSRHRLLALQESLRRLQSHFADWEQKFILKAPIDGQVSFFTFWSNNQHVNVGQEVMTVVPESNDIFGKIELSGIGAGKVKVGQTLRIKFDSYPFSEFGAVEGKVESISLIARDNMQLINVTLLNGLRTNFNKTLEFRQGMQGTADIITEESRLFERIFNQLRAILTSST